MRISLLPRIVVHIASGIFIFYLDVLVELLIVLSAFTISVHQLRGIFGLLEAKDHSWVFLIYPSICFILATKQM